MGWIEGTRWLTLPMSVLPLALNVSQNPVASWGSALIVNDLKLILGDQHFYVQPNKTFPTEDYPFVWDAAHTLKCGTLFATRLDRSRPQRGRG